MQVYRNVLSVKEFDMWNELVKHEILFSHHLYFHTNNRHVCHSKFHVNMFLSNLLWSEKFNRV